MNTPAAGQWRPDPTRRHELRYHNGYQWTDDVSDAGAQSKDADGLAALNVVPVPQAVGHAAPVKKSNTTKIVLIVLAVLAVLTVVVVGGCAVLIGAGVNKAVNDFNAEQKAHAITRADYKAIAIGSSESEVIAQLGKRPENRQDFESQSFAKNEPDSSSCIYYNRASGSFGDVYQLCFDNGKLTSKNAY